MLSIFKNLLKYAFKSSPENNVLLHHGGRWQTTFFKSKHILVSIRLMGQLTIHQQAKTINEMYVKSNEMFICFYMFSRFLNILHVLVFQWHTSTAKIYLNKASSVQLDVLHSLQVVLVYRSI